MDLIETLRSTLAAVDRDFERYPIAGGASVYPFVWSVLLAAHAEGLGGVIDRVDGPELPPTSPSRAVEPHWPPNSPPAVSGWTC